MKRGSTLKHLSAPTGDVWKLFLELRTAALMSAQ